MEQARDMIEDIVPVINRGGQGQRTGNGYKIMVADLQGDGRPALPVSGQGGFKACCQGVQDGEYFRQIGGVAIEGDLAADRLAEP